MNDELRLTPASPEELQQTLAFALRYDGRKRVHHSDELMARIAAEGLVRHLERAGFVLMKKPPLAGNAVPNKAYRKPWPGFREC